MELGKELDDELWERYSKITWDDEAIEELLCDIFIESYKRPPKKIILDFDATDIPLYGNQQMRFFHGYYDHYCYLPLYVFSGEHLLAARLRPSDIDGSAGSEEILEKLVKRIRARFPRVRIVFRGDSGFCREDILSLCERLKIKYIVGLARNSRLLEMIAPQLLEAKKNHQESGVSERVFTRFNYRTQKSWSCNRSVIAKAEHLEKGSNPRFVVTNIPEDEMDAQSLYEEVYCARGNMENRIKEQKLDLFSDRTSTGWMSSNQLRLWFSGFAYVFFTLLKRFIPEESSFNKNLPSILRLRLLKVAATIRLSVRKVWISLPESFPYWDIWRRICSAI